MPIPSTRDGLFVAGGALPSLHRWHTRRRLGWVVLLGLILACGSPVRAQNSYPQFEIRSIEFEGNDSFSSSELLQVMQVRESPGFFDKFLHNTISERLGRKSEFFNPVLLGEDLFRLRTFYREHGFQDVRIDTALSFSWRDSTVSILINITEGYRSLIDTLVYKGIVNAPTVVYEEIAAEPRIRQGDHFDKLLLEEEVNRILTIVRKDGYAKAAFARDSSAMTYYTSTRNYSIVLAFNLGKRYRFRDIVVVQEQEPSRPDIDERDVLRQLDIKSGDIYNIENIRSSERNLNRVGSFDRAWIETVFPLSDYPESTWVTGIVRIRVRDRHELAPELSLSDENGNFNLGAGLGYSTRNFLGGLRNANMRVRFRTSTISQFSNSFTLETDAVANLDATFELFQPYVFSNKVKGTWGLSYIRDKQKLYLSTIFQNRLGLGFRFAEFTTGFLDWTMAYSQLSKRQNIRPDSSDIDILRQLRDLEAQKEQFNSIISFTIQRDKTNDIFTPSRGFIHAWTIEESGLLPLLLSRWGWVNKPFTQFYRTNLVGRWYFDLTDNRRFNIVALKLRAGFEDKYGQSRNDTARAIPQTHRFYAGGGGSVRGWRYRELSASGDPQLGGNVLFEGSVEMRTNILQALRDDFWDRLWTVLFVDFGNVWGEANDLRLRGVAVAAGFGLRYDTFFGPFRVDYGVQIYDPRTTTWITKRRFWGDVLRTGVIHFGIGHAF